MHLLKSHLRLLLCSCNADDSCCSEFESCVSCCLSPDNRAQEKMKQLVRWAVLAEPAALLALEMHRAAGSSAASHVLHAMLEQQHVCHAAT